MDALWQDKKRGIRVFFFFMQSETNSVLVCVM